MKVFSDLVSDSTSQLYKFQIEILDCKVEKFDPGKQAFANVIMNSGDTKIFKFSDFKQEPACYFDMRYSLTLLEKPFGSAETPTFDLEK